MADRRSQITDVILAFGKKIFLSPAELWPTLQHCNLFARKTHIVNFVFEDFFFFSTRSTRYDPFRRSYAVQLL